MSTKELSSESIYEKQTHVADSVDLIPRYGQYHRPIVHLPRFCCDLHIETN